MGWHLRQNSQSAYACGLRRHSTPEISNVLLTKYRASSERQQYRNRIRARERQNKDRPLICDSDAQRDGSDVEHHLHEPQPGSPDTLHQIRCLQPMVTVSASVKSAIPIRINRKFTDIVAGN